MWGGCPGGGGADRADLSCSEETSTRLRRSYHKSGRVIYGTTQIKNSMHRTMQSDFPFYKVVDRLNDDVHTDNPTAIDGRSGYEQFFGSGSAFQTYFSN